MNKEDASMVLSASQIKTANICTKKWFFQKVIHLPTLSADHFTFGHVLHAVAERYLSATIKGEVPLPHPDWEYGKDRTYTSGPFEGQTIGDPIDLLPKGWDKDISVTDSSLIAALIQKSIEEGVL